MNRRQLLFVVLVNALVSLAIAIAVVWVAESRRPDAEELAARYTPPPPVVLIATPTVDTAAGNAGQAPTATTVAQPVPTSTPAPSQSGEPEIYVVQEGDSLFGIALRYNLTVDQLLEANNLSDPDFVFVGQRLVIPAGATAAGGSPAPTAPPAAGLEISEVTQPGDLAGESVLIVNESNNAINLQGWTLSRENGPTYTFGNLPLFPGGSVRVHSSSGTDTSVDLYWGQSAPVWTSGTVVRLLNAAGEPVASYTVP